MPMMIADMPGGMVSIRTGAKGPNFAPVSACATSANAIGEAAAIIRRGDADAMIAGGTEAAVVPIAIAGFNAARALSTRNDDAPAASRPFDATRDGFVLGEGAGILILERLEHAQQRGATILAELLGYGATADAYHITMPDEIGSGAAMAMELALKQAGLEPTQIDYLNAHGTSTQANDRLETLAIKKDFRRRHARSGQLERNRSSAIYSAPPARSRRCCVCWRSAKACCRRRSITAPPTRAATLTACRILRARSRSSARCRTRSASAGTMWR